MIRLIAAIDSNRGIAKDGHLPWSLPEDKDRFRKLTLEHGANVLVGRKTYGTYLIGRHIYLASHQNIKLDPGVTLVSDPVEFVKSFKDDLWVVGGQEIFNLSLPYAGELYLTLINQDFNCDRFFPKYSEFKVISSEGPYIYNNLEYTYQLLGRF